MPRALVFSNGDLFLDIDHQYVLRDIFYPHVGLWDHTQGNPWRFGVWSDGQFAWSDDDYERKLLYVADTLISDVTLTNQRLGVELKINDFVHYRRNVFVKKIVVRNLRPQASEVRLFFHHNPWLKESEKGNTVFYDPHNKSLVCYKDDVYIMANAMVGDQVGFTSYACGKKLTEGLAGTYKDAEDGVLGGNSIANGPVDSVGSVQFRIEPGQTITAYYWLSFGVDLPSVRKLDSFVSSKKPERLLEETKSYWRYWLSKPMGTVTSSELCLSHSPACPANHAQSNGFANLDERAASLYRRSILTIRAQSDGSGAIVAALDNSILQWGGDYYSYMWPRDGAICAAALDVAGHGEVPRNFFQFCARILTPDGYMPHKVYPNGNLASSWLSMVGASGEKRLPIQEDETALVLVALWKHYQKYRDTEFIYESDNELYTRLVRPAAEFLRKFRDPKTNLCLTSNDLWEERWGSMAFTVAAVYAGLKAAARLGHAVADPDIDEWNKAAEELKAAVEKHMYNEQLGRFVRMATLSPDGDPVQDLTIDASMCALWYLGMFKADDPRIVATMQAIKNRLWVKTSVGGVARYENDGYHQISQDTQNVPGNPWIIGTLWLAQWHIATARTLDDLDEARKLIYWAVEHTSDSGLLPEQLHPYSGEALSVSPLTWSHAAYALTVDEYVAKYQELCHGQANNSLS